MMFKKPNFVVARTVEEIEARRVQLEQDWSVAFAEHKDMFRRECAVRLSVLQARHDPDDAEKRWRGASDFVRYSAISESHWLYGYTDSPEQVRSICED